jgi:catechol 2,3-dioxygenase-like lactoylglutathione lyase family enzyme
MNLIPHHVGCAVTDLEKTAKTYLSAFAVKRRTRSFDVQTQGVSVCFLDLGNHVYLELVQSSSHGSKLESYLKTGFYHLCFLVDDLAQWRGRLMRQRFAPLVPFTSEAFGGAACQFFLSPQMHLFELAELSREDFEHFFAANAHDMAV